MSVSAFAAYLESWDLGYVAPKFQKHHINGWTFAETMKGEQDFKHIGVLDDFDIKRLLRLQNEVKEKTVSQKPDGLKEIVERCRVHLQAYEDNCKDLKKLVSEWRDGW